MKSEIRVLLANEPQRVRDAFKEFLQCQSGVKVVGTVLDPVELLLAVNEVQADVVVLTLPESGEMPGICTHLLTEYPHLLIAALSSNRQSACLYRQEIVSEPLPNTSDEDILMAIRRVKLAS
jgi:DNA-binding NarL/FixJ family response regulator